ncbi:MAG: hypothetical protein KC431_03795 [Myxococcales bacterium]|nr:hypothetical protein [Myxococcales bacterium]
MSAKQNPRAPRLALALSCALLIPLAACDDKDGDNAQDGQVAVAAELTPGKTAAALQLQAVVEMLPGDQVADVAALEAKLNDPEAKLAAVDIDGDDKTDFIEVVEKQDGDKTVLVLRAIPSSKAKPKQTAKEVEAIAVEVAVIELHVEDKEKIVIDAHYSEHIDHDVHVHVYHHEHPVHYEGGVIVLSEGCFFHHVFVVEHEHYHGHFYIVIDDHHHHVKHKKHKKHKGHGKGHGKHGHGGGVVVTW